MQVELQATAVTECAARFGSCPSSACLRQWQRAVFRAILEAHLPADLALGPEAIKQLGSQRDGAPGLTFLLVSAGDVSM